MVSQHKEELRISRIKLQNFRNYQSKVLTVDPSLTIFVGHNAVGKTNIIKALSSLYGGEEVLSAAQKLTENKYAVNAVKSLTYIYNAVKTAGFEKYITLDFGLLKGGYYTGLVIKGITSDYGATILDGGRYDGEGSGAVGFAIGTKRLLSALESRSNALESLRPCDYAYINLNGFSDTEFKTIQELRISGKRAVKLFFGDKSELLAYCKKSKIKNAIIFDGERAEEIEIDQR